MSKIKGVIFDMDCVIVHSNPVHKTIINEFLKKHNREISDDFLQTNVYGRTNQEWIPHVFGDISEEEIHDLAADKEEMFREVFDPQKEQVPGLIDFLKKLKEKPLKTVVATSAPKKNVNFILKKLNISNEFDEIVHALHIHHSKPHPEIYLKAAELIHLKPEECVVFEDSFSGVESALKAGTKVIGITTTHSLEELKDCDLVIDDFVDLEVEKVLE